MLKPVQYKTSKSKSPRSGFGGYFFWSRVDEEKAVIIRGALEGYPGSEKKKNGPHTMTCALWGHTVPHRAAL